MRVLFIDQNFDPKNIGGAFKSNFAIINELTKHPNFHIRILERKTKNYERNKFSAKQINPIIRTLSFVPIIKEIKRFKPDVIIVQRNLTSAALFAGFLKSIPVINVIRDPMMLCPKFVDIIDGFNNCSESITRKKCWKCINRWRTLRVVLLDKQIGFQHSLKSQLYTIYYKIFYYVTKIQLYLMKKAYVNVVASPLMKELVAKRIKSKRIVIRKITPIDSSKIKISNTLLSKGFIEQIDKSKKVILYIIPRNEGGSKGYPFVKLLLNKLSTDYLMVIVGTLLDGLKKYPNVINLDKLPTDNLYYLYQKANLTIVPSIYTEAFGRVILESLINKTPVITSLQCGANYLFKKKNYVKILPLKVDIWVKEIEDFFKKPVEIPEDDIKKIEKMFSPKECANQIIELTNKL